MYKGFIYCPHCREKILVKVDVPYYGGGEFGEPAVMVDHSRSSLEPKLGEELKVLVDGEWCKPSQEFLDTVRSIEKGLRRTDENILVVKGTEHSEEFIKPDEGLKKEVNIIVKKWATETLALWFDKRLDTEGLTTQILAEVQANYQALEEHCSELVDDVIRLEAELGEAKKQERWNIGEELCCLIGNKMLEDMEAGKLLGEQLRDYMNNCLKVGGSRQALKEEE